LAVNLRRPHNPQSSNIRSVIICTEMNCSVRLESSCFGTLLWPQFPLGQSFSLPPGKLTETGKRTAELRKETAL